ncbi:MAG TPA: glycosyltransferase, partial [Patescibacteria group bacterium]|nr:glycosyltransferase [Patescibacteria group bacterium]
TYWTQKTKTPEEFRKILASSKVGISVGGGGFDTMRFWEILGNNCILMTENIDIFPSNSKALDYRRVYQFNNLFDFRDQLELIATLLKNGYDQESFQEEYQKILNAHSSKARVRTILRHCRLII